MDAILRQTYHPIHDRLFCNGDRDGQERIAEQIIVRRLHPKLPSQHSFNWTGSPPFPRSFVLRGPLRSPGFRRRQGFLTESQSYRPYPLCWCRSPSSLCHHRATRCGQPTSSLPHPPVPPFRSNVIDFDSQAKVLGRERFRLRSLLCPSQGTR